MKKVPIGLALRDRLGDNGVHDLNDYVEEHVETGRVDVVNAITERFDHRIAECAKREDMMVGFARLEKQMADVRFDIVRWSFVFWLGQVTLVILAILLK